jgi:hypothetical protein
MTNRNVEKRSVGRRIAVGLLLVILLGIATGGRTALAQAPVRILFLHHSCGHNLIEQGGVRERLTALGHAFYDHGYNEQGLRLPDGTYAGRNFGVPGDNTNPDGFAAIFGQPLHDPPDNTFSHLMEYDIIAFKSCFPVSNIASDEQLAAYKRHYLAIRDRMDQYPDKVFAIVTQPPQVPGASSRAEADRARAWTEWLQSDAFLAGHDNVVVFDFFDHLAGDDNFLRRDYRMNNQDAHPNPTANAEIGPRFVAFLDRVARDVEPDAAPATPVPTATAEPDASEPEEPAPATAAPASGETDAVMLDVYADWETSTSGPDARIQCGVTPDAIHESRPVVELTYDLAEGAYADCGQYDEAPRDWSSADGFGLWMQVDETVPVILTVLMGESGAVSPFQVTFRAQATCCLRWDAYFFPWSAFEPAPWAEAGSAQVLDPAEIAGYGFTIDAYDEPKSGTLLLDVVGPTAAEAEEDTPVAEVTEDAPEARPTPDATATPADAKEAPLGGLCPGSLALSVGMLGVTWVGRRKRQ